MKNEISLNLIPDFDQMTKLKNYENLYREIEKYFTPHFVVQWERYKANGFYGNNPDSCAYITEPAGFSSKNKQPEDESATSCKENESKARRWMIICDGVKYKKDQDANQAKKLIWLFTQSVSSIIREKLINKFTETFVDAAIESSAKQVIYKQMPNIESNIEEEYEFSTELMEFEFTDSSILVKIIGEVKIGNPEVLPKEIEFTKGHLSRKGDMWVAEVSFEIYGLVVHNDLVDDVSETPGPNLCVNKIKSTGVMKYDISKTKKMANYMFNCINNLYKE